MFLNNKIPPPIVCFVCGVLMWLSVGRLVSFEGATLQIALIVLLFIIATFFALPSVVQFIQNKTTVNPMSPEQASKLVTNGMYRLSRNPMYVGYSLYLCTWATLLWSWWSLLGVVGFVVYITQFQIKPEEAVLEKLFVEDKVEYKAKLMRWLKKITSTRDNLSHSAPPF